MVFYEKVLGWNIRRRESDQPAFDDAARHVSGSWFTGRPPCLIVCIWVPDINAILALITANGGEALETPHPDNPGSTSLIASYPIDPPPLFLRRRGTTGLLLT